MHAKYIQCMRDLYLGSHVPFVLSFKMPQYLDPTKRMMECWSFFKATIYVDVGRGHIGYWAHSSGIQLKSGHLDHLEDLMWADMLVGVLVFLVSWHPKV